METKELKIVPPEGYEVDKENSTFECIKFKPLEKRWRDSNPIVSGYYILHYPDTTGVYWSRNLDVFVSEKQAKSAFAIAQIGQIMANDKRFGGPITDEEWNNRTIKYCIMRHFDHRIAVGNSQIEYYFLAFHTSEQRDLFLAENKDLIKDYLMLD